MEKLIFDLDGTLADSMGAWGETVVDILKTANVSYPDNINDIITPLSLTETAHYFRDSLGVTLTVEEILSRIDAHMAENYANTIALKEGALNVLKSYCASGHSLNILTASPHRLIDSAIQRWGIAPLFDNIWSCEDFGLPKNDREIYRMAAKRLGTIPSECRMFDDNFVALHTAHKAGLGTIGVYDYSSRHSEKKIRAFCDRYIYSFSELI